MADKTRKQYLKHRQETVKLLTKLIKYVKSCKDLEKVNFDITPKWDPIQTCGPNEILQDSLGKKKVGSSFNLNMEFGTQIIK